MGLRRNALLVGPVVAAVVAVVAQGCGGDSGSGLDPNGNPDGGGGANDSGNGGGFEDGNGGGNLTDASCATSSVDRTRGPVYMQMVLDGSGSMDGLVTNRGAGRDCQATCVGRPGSCVPCNVYATGQRSIDSLNKTRPSINDENRAMGPTGFTGNKWLAARDALFTFWGQLAAQSPTDNTFGVGFHVFNSTKDTSDTATDIKIAPVNSTHLGFLRARIAPLEGQNTVYGDGTTPLLGNIRGQGTGVLKAFQPAAPLPAGGTKILVLITDGVPTGTGESTSGALTEVQNLRTNDSIRTFVIGVGEPSAETSDYNESFLSDLAVRGGVDARTCNPNWAGDPREKPCHFQITPSENPSAEELTQKFTAAINKIRDSVVSCTFPLELNVGAGGIDKNKINVVYTPGTGANVDLKKGLPNGWTYDNENAPKSVILNGSSCTTLQGDPRAKVRIVIGCGTIIN